MHNCALLLLPSLSRCSVQGSPVMIGSARRRQEAQCGSRRAWKEADHPTIKVAREYMVPSNPTTYVGMLIFWGYSILCWALQSGMRAQHCLNPLDTKAKGPSSGSL